jgi:ABC-type nitrate/sulfonate/bicarbonate transport system substrate-binding protein
VERWRCFSKIVTFTRSNDINALVSGDIQFDQTSPDEVIHSALGGFPVRMIMATTRGLNLALAVQPAIKSAAELKGKSVAVTSFSGLGMSKDQVVPLDVGGKSARLEALLHGRVAAAILDPPYTTIATKAGYKLLVDLAQRGRCFPESAPRRFGDDRPIRRGTVGRHALLPRSNESRREPPHSG